jgi:hypothetical protein
VQSLQNSRGTITSVQKTARATDRKRKAEDALYQASRDSDSNSEDGALAPAPAPTKSKGKGKAKAKADSTRKSLRKRAKKA